MENPWLSLAGSQWRLTIATIWQVPQGGHGGECPWASDAHEVQVPWDVVKRFVRRGLGGDGDGDKLGRLMK